MDNLLIDFAQQELGIIEIEFNFCVHERKTFDEIQSAIVQNDISKLTWFAGFGDRLLEVLLNVHAYRMDWALGLAKLLLIHMVGCSDQLFWMWRNCALGLRTKAALAIIAPFPWAMALTES